MDCFFDLVIDVSLNPTCSVLCSLAPTPEETNDVTDAFCLIEPCICESSPPHLSES